MYKKKEDLTVPPGNMAWPFFLRCGPHDRAMTQVSSPPLGAMEIPRQSEELNQGAGLATSFAHDRAWAGVCPCRSMSLQNKAIYPPRLTAGQASCLVGGDDDRDVERAYPY